MGNRIAKLSLLAALALIAFLVESLFPPLFIPGAKLGLANVFITVCLAYYSFGEAFLIIIAKSILSAVFGGNLFSVAYSLSGGIISLIIAWLLIKFCHKNLSLSFIGAASACAHNLTQVLVFSLMTKSIKVLLYAPYLAILGVLAGTLTGVIAYYILKIIPPKFFGVNH